MPSAVRKRSYGSVTIFWLDREEIDRALEALVKEFSRRPEVEAVILFGSFARGEATPRSDLDLLVLLSRAERPFRERLNEYLPRGFPMDLEIFPLTLEEARRSPLAREALRTGRLLWARTPGKLRILTEARPS